MYEQAEDEPIFMTADRVNLRRPNFDAEMLPKRKFIPALPFHYTRKKFSAKLRKGFDSLNSVGLAPLNLNLEDAFNEEREQNQSGEFDLKNKSIPPGVKDLITFNIDKSFSLEKIKDGQATNKEVLGATSLTSGCINSTNMQSKNQEEDCSDIEDDFNGSISNPDYSYHELEDKEMSNFDYSNYSFGKDLNNLCDITEKVIVASPVELINKSNLVESKEKQFEASYSVHIPLILQL